jgi:hypothetical protein
MPIRWVEICPIKTRPNCHPTGNVTCGCVVGFVNLSLLLTETIAIAVMCRPNLWFFIDMILFEFLRL